MKLGWPFPRRSSSSHATDYYASKAGPDFLCVGAFKAGTTWLYAQLHSHPEFWMPPIKELHYFDEMSRSRHPDRASWHKIVPRDGRDEFFFNAMDSLCAVQFIDRQGYANVFAPKRELLSGDITPVYSIVPEEIVTVIMKYFPDLKIIFIARDPVERAWSAISMAVRNGGFAAFDASDGDVVMQHLLHPDIITRSFPSMTVARWRRHVPSEQIRIYFFDELQGDPAGLREKIILFLGANPAKARLPAERKSNEGKYKLPMSDRIRDQVAHFFAEELKRCANELGGPGGTMAGPLWLLAFRMSNGSGRPRANVLANRSRLISRRRALLLASFSTFFLAAAALGETTTSPADKPALRSPARQLAVDELIPWLLQEDGELRGIPFSKVILDSTGKRVLAFDPHDEANARVLKEISAVLNEVMTRLNAPESVIQNVPRINEVSSHFENLMRELLNAAPGLECAFPKTSAERLQRSGYPDLKVTDKQTRRVYYLDPKLYAAGSRDSSFRTFYFEPRLATNKVREDAVHFIVGFEHEKKSGNGGWNFTRWDLVDLSKFRVKLKAEFQGSNRDIYRPDAIVATSRTHGHPERSEAKSKDPAELP